jgi:EmrB/QacA subfamily drug resistance transporter
MTISVEAGPTGATSGRAVLLATILGASMVFIDSTALNVVLPALQLDLQATGTDLLWISNAYTLLLASGILVGGSLGDHYGRKRVYMIGIALFAAASLVSGLAPSASFLIAARVAQGAGGALMVPGSLALISASFDANSRGRAIGLWSSFAALTTIVGPVLGGFLAGRGLWRGVFFLNLPLALLALVTLRLRVPESRDETLSRRLDYPGALLATLGLAGLTYSLTEAPSRGWNNPLILAMLLAGVAALAAFVIVERRAAEPMVPFSLFRSRTFTGTNLITLCLYGALYVNIFFYPLNLIQAQGYPESQAGLTLLPFAILLTLLSRWAGGLVDRYGPRLLLTIGPAIVGGGFAAMALPGLTNGPADYWVTFFPALLLLGLGMGLTVAPLTTAVMGSVSSSHAGIASGINNAVSRTAGVLALATLGALALLLFSQALEARTASLPLPAANRVALRTQAAKLGGAQPPASLPPALRDPVQLAIRLAFVDTYRVVMWIDAGLAWLSAGLAALLVEKRPAPAGEQQASSVGQMGG